jgi:DNA polymerase
MDDARRLQYLAAMGVSVWRLRSAEVAADGKQPGAEPLNRDLAAQEASAQTAVPAPSANANTVDGMDWPTLEASVAGCRACRLCERRNNTVFGVGDPNAELMLIGEGPGHDEDMRGEPFVGRAGQLLNRMLTAMELDREQVYIANVVKCRPPNNRNPNPDEASACRAFLARQIALVRPRLLVSLGGVSASNLLETTESVERLRGRVHAYRPTDGSEPTPLIVTYHPSYYLRPHSTADKAKGWQDLQRIMRRLRASA